MVAYGYIWEREGDFSAADGVRGIAGEALDRSPDFKKHAPQLGAHSDQRLPKRNGSEKTLVQYADSRLKCLYR